MAEAVGVVFSPGGKVYSFDPAGLELAWNDKVICQTARGKEHGRVVQANHVIPDEELTGRLKRVIRRATEDDGRQVLENRKEAKASISAFREVIAEHQLPIKAIRSATIIPLLSLSMMLIAVNEPVRMRTRYGYSLPSLTT